MLRSLCTSNAAGRMVAGMLVSRTIVYRVLTEVSRDEMEPADWLRSDQAAEGDA